MSVVVGNLTVDLLCYGFRYYGYGRNSLVLAFIALVFGIGLAYNCIRGLSSQEGMYDEGSSSYMTVAQWVGTEIGIGAAIWCGIVVAQYVVLLL